MCLSTDSQDPSTDLWAFRLLFQLKADREFERTIAIANGIIADPEKKTTLENAIKPVGQCEDMCPEYERAERIVQKTVDRCEKVSMIDSTLAGRDS